MKKGGGNPGAGLGAMGDMAFSDFIKVQEALTNMDKIDMKTKTQLRILKSNGWVLVNVVHSQTIFV